MMVLFTWKLIHKGNFFNGFSWSDDTWQKLKISPMSIDFHLYETIVVQMPSFSDNDVCLDNDAI